jgi:hypothetical protein
MLCILDDKKVLRVRATRAEGGPRADADDRDVAVFDGLRPRWPNSLGRWAPRDGGLAELRRLAGIQVA